MALKLMYITNRPEIAKIAEAAGIDRIFVDMEFIGKASRQGGMDTVQLHHTVMDIRNIRNAVSKAKVMVRVNPIHTETEFYPSSECEINDAINAGAEILMLPYFKTSEEVLYFLRCVNGRVKTLLLFETPESVALIDEILSISGIDEAFIGLNDLSLGYGMKFMFQLLADGMVDALCAKFRDAGIPYGFGGIAALGKGKLPAEYIIKDHYRLGSTCTIVSRSFCNTSEINDIDEIASFFKNGIKEIRELEHECLSYSCEAFDQNHKALRERVNDILLM